MSYRVIGLMSGTSLDGLDMAYCEFEEGRHGWSYKIICSETVAYTKTWQQRLANLETTSALDFARTDAEYGHLTGKLCRDFMDRNGIDPGFIASHGHTIFHQPSNHFTTQIGNGSAIASETGKPVISDFRSLDIALGGQGAPLVPVGDRFLFADYDYCLNLGGFSNISFESETGRIAFDICPVNIILNYLSRMVGREFDRDGQIASGGTVIEPLLKQLNELAYYQQAPPKSLGKEWVLATVIPIFEPYLRPGNETEAIPPLLATFCKHIAMQVLRVTVTGTGETNSTGTTPGGTGQRGSGPELPKKKMLVTGGGANNRFLVEMIRDHNSCDIVIPDERTVGFKEALIFAFLGVLRWRSEANCLASVTGASRDSSGGTVVLPYEK
jgi:anhydro-N-acetylmuramic acid kinase